MPPLDDVDAARKVGVAVPPGSKSEYLEASQQLQPGFVATVDGTDPSIGWTAQHLVEDREGVDGEEAKPRGFVAPGDDLPGQVYLPGQLPDPQAAIQAGLAPVKIPEHLITTNEDHIQGPEPSELAILERREALRASVVARREGLSVEDMLGDSDGDGVPDSQESGASEESEVPAGQNKNGGTPVSKPVNPDATPAPSGTNPGS